MLKPNKDYTDYEIDREITAQLLIKSLKELQDENEELKKEIERLEKRVEELESENEELEKKNEYLNEHI